MTLLIVLSKATRVADPPFTTQVNEIVCGKVKCPARMDLPFSSLALVYGVISLGFWLNFTVVNHYLMKHSRAVEDSIKTAFEEKF